MVYLAIAARLALAATFALAVAGKLRGRAAFRAYTDSVRDLTPLPSRPTVVAVGLVAAEALVVALLAVPATVPAGALLAMGLLATFCVAISAAMARATRVRCACFGADGAVLGARHLARNAFLALLAPAALLSGSAESGGAVVAAVAGLVLGVLVTRLDDLVDLFTPYRATT